MMGEFCFYGEDMKSHIITFSRITINTARYEFDEALIERNMTNIKFKRLDCFLFIIRDSCTT